ncbi:hypothetical protein DFH09DRAFT_1366356, partial [Mycena vulgaris]
MKTSVLLAFISLTISAVEALPRDTNANRLARGLPPLPPHRRQDATGKRLKSRASSTPFHCDTKKTFCCTGLEATTSSAATSVLSGLGIPASSCGDNIGIGCIAALGDTCLIGTPSKCCGTLFGLVGIDCAPVTASSSSSSSHSATSSSAASSSVRSSSASTSTSASSRSSSSSSASV